MRERISVVQNHQHKPETREERSLVLWVFSIINFLMGAVGLGTSVFNTVHIKDVEDHVIAVESKIAALIERENNIPVLLSNMSSTMDAVITNQLASYKQGIFRSYRAINRDVLGTLSEAVCDEISKLHSGLNMLLTSFQTTSK